MLIWTLGSRMEKIIFSLITLSVLSCCSGPSYFNSPADYVGGNRAAAVDAHCASRAGEGKDNLAYKLCEQSYNTHYGN